MGRGAGGVLPLLLFAAAAVFAGSSVGLAGHPRVPALAPQPDQPPPRWLPPPAEGSPPEAIEVPAIGLRARVVPVGLRADGAAETPPPTLAGWWRLGAEPGGRGSAVLLGHRDTRHAPAVFARLPELRPGHLIGLRGTDDLVTVFAVRAVTTHDKDALPKALWQPRGPHRLLRLITCGGPFEAARRSYRRNVVVHAQVVGAWRPPPETPHAPLPAARLPVR